MAYFVCSCDVDTSMGVFFFSPFLSGIFCDYYLVYLSTDTCMCKVLSSMLVFFLVSSSVEFLSPWSFFQ
ncbi:hypothetical protein QBC38DRAFT_481443 [Podospora fimiseda]|uniref:Uncharacterized protein n=1 Tax=Podospora fimiseda TaxID=252190 RepID=A0AAN7BML1_9PEZI|nr:hypothetical protein QBC38DRAFT_481443 [Podospora fimiseda]